MAFTVEVEQSRDDEVANCKQGNNEDEAEQEQDQDSFPDSLCNLRNAL